MQDLAERVLFSRSGLTRLVDRMAAAGSSPASAARTTAAGTFAVLTAAGPRACATPPGCTSAGSMTTSPAT